jgi:hypothetical protein
VHTCDLNYVRSINRRITVQATGYSKITKAKRARSMAQMVEHLPGNREALNSKPSTTKKKKTNLITCP